MRWSQRDSAEPFAAARVVPRHSSKEDDMAKALARFTIEPGGDGYSLHIEDEDGATLELTATAEQLDLIAEAIEEQLEEDEDDNDVVE